MSVIDEARQCLASPLTIYGREEYRRIIEGLVKHIAALSAQQEPVAWYYERGTDSGIAFNPDRDPEKRWTPLYTAPPPGVREGMLVDALRDIARGGLQCADFEKYAVSVAKNAITRAAEQVNAEIQPSAPSDVMGPVKHDAPVMKAWNNYKAGDDFRNTRRWALHEAHVDGSLWAAFYAGYFACAVDSTDPSAPHSEQTHVCVPVEPDEAFIEIVARELCRHAYPARSLDEALSPNIRLWMRMKTEAKQAIEAVLRAATGKEAGNAPA